MKYADALRVALDTATQARTLFNATDETTSDYQYRENSWRMTDANKALANLLTPKGPELLRLIEAVQARADHYCHWPMQKCDDPDCTSGRAISEASAVFAALAALDGGER